MLPFLIIVKSFSVERRMESTEEELLRSFSSDGASHSIRVRFDADTVESEAKIEQRKIKNLRRKIRALRTEIRELSLSAVLGEYEEQFSIRLHLLSNLAEYEEFKRALFLFIRDFYLLSQEQNMALLDVILYNMAYVVKNVQHLVFDVGFLTILYSNYKIGEKDQRTLTDLGVFLLMQEKLFYRIKGVAIFRSILCILNATSEVLCKSGREKDVFKLDEWQSKQLLYDHSQDYEWQTETFVKVKIKHSIWEHFFYRILAYVAIVSVPKEGCFYVAMCLSSEIWKFIGHRRGHLEGCVHHHATRFSHVHAMKASYAEKILERIAVLGQWIIPEEELDQLELPAWIFEDKLDQLELPPWIVQLELPPSWNFDDELDQLEIPVEVPAWNGECSPVNFKDIKKAREEARESASV